MRPVAEHEEQCEEHNEKVCREEQRIPGKVYPLRKKEGADGFPAFQEGGFDLSAAVHDEKAYQFLAQPSHSGYLGKCPTKVFQMSFLQPF